VAARSRTARRVVGIGGVFLRSKSPKRLARWDRDHLGMEIRNQVVTYEWRSLARDGAIGSTLWAALSKWDRDRGPGRATASINYRVVDLDRTLTVPRKEGVKVDPRSEESP
jgi:hypothetical protein